MTNKPVYKLLDDKGRVYVPQSIRSATDMNKGDIVRLEVVNGALKMVKVDIIEVGDQSPEAREAYVFAAAKYMPNEKRLSLAARLLDLVEREG